MNRDLAIGLLLVLEGGYVNNPKDPGGATKYGVTQRTLDSLQSTIEGLPANVQLLTSVQATAIYAGDQWKAIQGDSLPPSLAPLMLNAAVNFGEGSAIKLLQAIVGVAQDGLMGPATVRAIQTWHSPYMIGQTLAEEVAAHMALHYARLDPKMDAFELGWFRRLLRVIVASLTLAPGTV